MLNHLLIHRCTIQRNLPQNVDGTIEPSWADLATGVKCLVQESSGDTQQNEGGLTYVAGADVYLPPATDVRPNVGQDQPDRIVMTTPPRMAGVIYQVESVSDQAGQGHHLLARVTRRPDLAPGA